MYSIRRCVLKNMGTGYVFEILYLPGVKLLFQVLFLCYTYLLFSPALGVRVFKLQIRLTET